MDQFKESRWDHQDILLNLAHWQVSINDNTLAGWNMICKLQVMQMALCLDKDYENFILRPQVSSYLIIIIIFDLFKIKNVGVNLLMVVQYWSNSCYFTFKALLVHFYVQLYLWCVHFSMITYLFSLIYFLLAFFIYEQHVYGKVLNQDGSCNAIYISISPDYAPMLNINTMGCWNWTDINAEYIIHSMTQVAGDSFAFFWNVDYITPNSKFLN